MTLWQRRRWVGCLWLYFPLPLQSKLQASGVTGWNIDTRYGVYRHPDELVLDGIVTAMRNKTRRKLRVLLGTSGHGWHKMGGIEHPLLSISLIPTSGEHLQLKLIGNQTRVENMETIKVAFKRVFGSVRREEYEKCNR